MFMLMGILEFIIVGDKLYDSRWKVLSYVDLFGNSLKLKFLL